MGSDFGFVAGPAAWSRILYIGIWIAIIVWAIVAVIRIGNALKRLADAREAETAATVPGAVDEPQ
ncbi:hypothetical protein [Agrococcus casei]|uniref:Uncharacterized protein n=1 Tax=Agrococcus casei LMG 22410 TaxID=1255656 RepID=A0A1R4F253_9MICO|nr:hypothetical protein [Agrococcus casei]SJM49955.1 hypothetical protein CZ674_02205 [Agrococcus casei LMG 22410]